MDKKRITGLRETIAVFILIPVLFMIFFFINSAQAKLPYEFLFLSIFFINKKIRENIFTNKHLVCSLTLTALLTAAAYRDWQSDAVIFIMYLIGFFITFRVFIALWLMIKQYYKIDDATETKKPMTVFFEVFAAVFISLLSIWLYKYYPNGLSPDTVNQWEQIHGIIPFNDIHPPLHTLILMGLLAIRDCYDIVILFNIFIIAVMAAIFSKYFYEKGIKSHWLIALNIVFSFTLMSRYYMYPYKDIPYTAVLGAVTYMLMRTMDDTDKKIIHGVIWGALLMMCSSLRYNGIVCAILVSVYLVYLFIKKRRIKQLAAMVVTFSILTVGLQFIAYNVMEYKHDENGFSLQVFGSGIASVVANDGNISDEELEKIDEILGVDWINAHYEKREAKKLIWDTETHDPDGFFKERKNQVYNNFFVVGMGRHKAEVIRLYISLFIKNPMICINEIFENTYRIWGYDGIFSNVILLTILFSAVLILWKGKKVKMSWIVFIPVLANVLSIAVSTITKEMRYLMPTVTLFPPLIFYITVSGNGMKIKSERKALAGKSE